MQRLAEQNLRQTTALKIYESLGEEVRPLFYLDGDHSYYTVYREMVSIIEK